MGINEQVDIILNGLKVEDYMNNKAESVLMLLATETMLADPELTPERSARVDAWRRLLLGSMNKPSPEGGRRKRKNKSRKHR